MFCLMFWCNEYRLFFFVKWCFFKLVGNFFKECFVYWLCFVVFKIWKLRFVVWILKWNGVRCFDKIKESVYGFLLVV